MEHKKEKVDKSLRMMEKIVKRHEKHSVKATQKIGLEEAFEKKKGIRKSWFFIIRIGLVIIIVAVGLTYVKVLME